MLHPRRFHWVVFALLCMVAARSSPAQVRVDEGPLLRKRLHERFLRLLRGGDGHFYAVKGSSGRYWQFGGEGEQGLQVIRLDAGLRPVDTLRTRRWGGSSLHMALEVLPTPTGIGLLTVRRDSASGMNSLQVCTPEFGGAAPRLHWRKLADMPQLKVGLQQPVLRVVFSPDSSHVLLAWRRLARDEGTDRSLVCIVLDRGLQIVRAPFYPFKHLNYEVLMRDILLLDADHMVFTAQSMSEGPLLGTGTVGYGIMHYDIADGLLRHVRLGSRRDVPIETRLSLDAAGRVTAAGWYLGAQGAEEEGEQRPTGIYIGRVTDADSLEGLRQLPLDPPVRALVLQRERQSGAVGIRPSFHSTLLPGAGGHLLVLHYRGDLGTDLGLQSPQRRANNCLLVWAFDQQLEYEGQYRWGFFNWGREEVYETFSWRPLLVDGRWKALVTDEAQVHRDADPAEARSFTWDLCTGGFEPVGMAQGPKYCLLAPREMVRVGEGEWVAVALAGRRWRLVRVVP